MDLLTKKYISLNEILRYLESNERSRNMQEGEAILDGEFLYDCGYTVKSCHEMKILAYCRKTSALNDLPHEIKGTLKVEENELRVTNFMCSCKAGSPKCKHVAAVLIQLNRTKIDTLEQFSVTDVKCYWATRKKEASARVEATPLEAYCHIRAHKEPVIFSSKQQQVSFQKKAITMLLAALPNSVIALHKRGRDMGSTRTTKEGNNVEELVPIELQAKKPRRQLFNAPDSGPSSTSDADVLETSVVDCGLATASVKDIEIPLPESLLVRSLFDRIENSHSLAQVAPYNLESTPPCCRQKYETLHTSLEGAITVCSTQQGTPEWLQHRKYRITGSICHVFYKYGTRKHDWQDKVNKVLINPPDISKLDAVSHGSKSESAAVHTYVTNSVGTSVLNTGLIVPPQHPWLGYSPDGIVVCEGKPTKLIEVKCPLQGKVKTAKSMSVPYLVPLDSNNNTMVVNHPYYSQMQLGMAILDLPVCDLIVHATYDNTQLVVTVHRNDDYVKELLTTLQAKYFKYILHCFCLQVALPH